MLRSSLDRLWGIILTLVVSAKDVPFWSLDAYRFLCIEFLSKTSRRNWNSSCTGQGNSDTGSGTTGRKSSDYTCVEIYKQDNSWYWLSMHNLSESSLFFIVYSWLKYLLSAPRVIPVWMLWLCSALLNTYCECACTLRWAPKKGILEYWFWCNLCTDSHNCTNVEYSVCSSNFIVSYVAHYDDSGQRYGALYAVLAGLICTSNKWANCRSWQFSKSFHC